MLIDLKSGEAIPANPILTLTQSLVKSVDLKNSDGVSFTKQSENDWDVILQNNEVLHPKIIIDQFGKTLETLLMGGKLDKEYCAFMLAQCQNWEITDQFTIIE